MKAEKDLPYYRLWVKDFDTNENVRVLDLAELGLYLSCLNHSWVNNGLPTDTLEIARALKVRPALFVKLWKRVEKCFHLEGERLINPRQEKERARALAKSRQAAEAVAERERQKIGRSSDDDLRTRAGAGSDSVSESDFEVIKKTSLPNDFSHFLEAVKIAELPHSDIDIGLASAEWSRLDFDQKIAATQGLIARKEAGDYDDPKYRPLPQNYISEHKWQRPIRGRARDPATDKTHAKRNEVLQLTKVFGAMREAQK